MPTSPSNAELKALASWEWGSADEHFAQVADLFETLASSENVLELTQHLWSQPDDHMRALGFDLLAVQALNFDWHVAPLIQEVGTLDHHQTSRRIRWSAAHALSTISDDDRILDPLLEFAQDSDATIRWLVAKGIPATLDSLPETAIHVLMNLMRDPDPDVRDMATMALATRPENDSAEIRDALIERLDDTSAPEADTAGEAALGLALRHDERVLPVLIRELSMPDVGNLYVEAAAELGDARLWPLLIKLKVTDWQEDDPRPYLLDQALASCSESQPPEKQQ
ncbi:HEAT repeat domain-containing protein [Nonomuraea spiralis]|uniref:HEAT repeat domain-containing protein n=1 Tax=Nonomuraea spiralis TaxID=46182 RepID=UPI00379A79D9